MYTVSFFTGCIINKDAYSPGFGMCGGQVNLQSFEFDQATFDERLGPDTFPLATFFTFEFSPVP